MKPLAKNDTSSHFISRYRLSWLFPVLLALLSAPVSAQSTLLKVCESLENAQMFVRYRKFKDDFERMNRQFVPTLADYSQYEMAQMAYEQVEVRFNGFLEVVKADLSNFQTIKEMTRDPLGFANRYAGQYQEVVTEYEGNFMPVYSQLSVGKGIPPELVDVGVDVIKEVIGLIGKRPEMKEEKFNVILSLVNTFFYDKIRMKSWSEMGFPAPEEPYSEEGEGEYVEEIVEGEESLDLTPMSAQPVEVQQPVFGELAGWVEFVTLGPGNQEMAMPFNAPVTKDIIVQTRRTEQGEVVTGQAGARVAEFASVEAYGDGTQFRIRVHNTAGMYVLVLNSGNDVLFLYPYANEALGGCAEFKPVTKDIHLGYLDATPVVGQDANGNTVLPTPDCRFSPPRDRYFTISGNSQKEQFAILLTRSEMDVNEVEYSLEQATGTLAERLGQVFAGSAVDPAGVVSVSGNRMQFNAGSAEQTVLPIVFEIYR